MADNLFKSTLLLLASFSIFISCSSKTPEIISIDPKIGRMGEFITLKGNNFGETQEDSYVTIAGVAPTFSSYQLWNNEQIIVRAPELGESGIVYVHVSGKKSNGVLFSNSSMVPKPMEGEEFGLEPKIISVTPQTGLPGTLITINGSNFGVSRSGGSSAASGVFFSWDYESSVFNPYAVTEPEFIEVSEIEFGYESWSPREIRVRLPDGVKSGSMEVRTLNGRSRPYVFNAGSKPGNKSYTDKRSYTVNYSVDIRVQEATRPNTLYLWMPMPVTSPSQRNVSLVFRSAEPLLENHHGVSLFKFDNLSSGVNRSVNLSFRIDVYAVETEVNFLSVRQLTAPFLKTYIENSPLIPVSDPLVMTTVNAIIGREQNQYLKAKAIYEWILANITINEFLPASSGNITAAIEQKRADPYTTALVFTTLVRAAGLPCIPASGVLIDRSGQTFRHYWTELWIDDFGWLPVDPAAGAGAVPASFPLKENHASYYFGNMDNHRITFSRGELTLLQMENRGRLVSHIQSYSLQNIWEEASGGLESYTSFWGDIIISGIYQ